MGQSATIGRRNFLEKAGAMLAGTAVGVGGAFGGEELSSPSVRYAAMFPWPIWP